MTKRECRECGLKRQEKFFTSERGRVCTTCQKKKRRTSSKNSRLKMTYGITMEDYQAMLDAQGGRCAICEGLRAVFDVDHDHQTGMVRGLLCKSCNRHLLWAAADRPKVLRSAATYLETPPAVSVIGECFVPVAEESAITG